MVGVMYDITEQKLLEKQKEDFIGIASHELKTPVTSIKAYAELVQEQLTETGDTLNGDLMNRLSGQIEKLSDLISDLLDTTKISEGQLRLTLRPTDVSALLAEKLDDMKRIADQTFLLNMDTLHPVVADSDRIGQVVTNLLANAVKYSPRNSTITVTAHNEAEGIRVSVRDEGYGISEPDQRKIFDQFYRVTTNNMDTFPGTGLGLYVSRQIIERHGGKITVDSHLGEGSVFSFTIPYNNNKG
jgi:two-component system CheB/CheR fusion protein